MRTLLLAVGLLFAAAPSEARVQLKSSYPVHGSHFMFHKPVVYLEFTERLVEASVEILDPRGRNIAVDSGEIDPDPGTEVMVDIRSLDPPRPLMDGPYVVRWSVRGVSGDMGRDTFSFHIMKH